MNGNLSIELAHQHQQALLDHAGRSRLAVRRPRTRRPALTIWLRTRSRARRSEASNAAVPPLAALGCTHR